MKDKVIIIAEAGVNHNGDLDLAKKLIDLAAFANADYIKFQTFSADKVVSSSNPVSSRNCWTPLSQTRCAAT